MTKIAEFVYWLNRTDPGVKNGVLVGVWNAGRVTARLRVAYKTEVRLDILPEEIEKAGDIEAFALEVAGRMKEQYREKMSMPLLEGKSG